VASFTDAEIRALVETGEYSDARATEWITNSLIGRRDKIAEVWFSKVLPLDKFSVVDSKLTFEDLSAARDTSKAAREYQVRWASQDRRGRVTKLPDAVGRNLPVPLNDTEYLLATIQSPGDDASVITVYLCQRQTGFEVVGIDR